MILHFIRNHLSDLTAAMMKLTFALLALAVAIASQAEAKPIDEDELNSQFAKFKVRVQLNW